MVIDPSYKFESILASSADKMLIACSGLNKGLWDVNNGVFFLRLHHPYTLLMLEYVIAVCEGLPASNQQFVSDQRPMQQFLRGLGSLGQLHATVTTYAGEDRNRFNYNGKFIRHAFRTHGTLYERAAELSALRAEIQW